MIAQESISAGPCEADSHRERRESRARKTAIVGLAAKAINYGIRLVSIPLSLSLLGSMRYGLWLTVGSTLTWLSLSELGIFTGLVNTVSRAYSKEDWEDARGYISTGFFCYSLLAALALCVVLFVSGRPGLPALIGAPKELASEARSLFLICGAVWALSFSIYAIGPLCLALQEGYLMNYAQVAAGSITLATLPFLAWHGTTVIGFALAMGLPPLLSNAALATYFLHLRHPRVRPSLRYWNVGRLKTLIGIGGPMALVQIADICIVYSVNVMVANRLGLAQVPHYAIPATAFIVIMSLCINLVGPYLPAYAEAAGRGDWSWIRRAAIRNLSIVMALMLLATVSLVAVGPYIVRLWTHGQVNPSRSLLLWLGLFYMMMTWATTNTTLLVGLGLVKIKALIHCTAAMLFVTGSWIGLAHFGLIAVPISGCVAFSVDAMASLPMALRHLKHSAAGRTLRSSVT